MQLLLVGTPEDTSYAKRLQELIPGHKCAGIFSEHIELLTAVTAQADSKKVDAIICTNQSFLDKVLAVQPDWTAPNTRKVMSLDLFLGSLLYLTLPFSKRSIPVLVLNPLKQLITVPFAKFLYSRLLTKLTKPETWFEPVPFSWELIDAKNFSAVNNYLSTCDIIGVDCETIRADLQIDCIAYAGVKYKTKESKVFVLPLATLRQTPEIYIYNIALARKLNASLPAKVLQNGMYDSSYFARWGMPLHAYLWDTKHFFHSQFTELPKDLGYITAFALRDVRYWKDDGKSGDLKDYYSYCAKDAWSTVWTLLSLIKDAPDWAINNYLQEFPLIFPCMQSGTDGFAVSLEQWKPLEENARNIAQTALAELQALTGYPNFNPGSSQQVVRLLHTLGATKLTSSDNKSIETFRALHPLADRIGEQITTYRESAKELSTYWKQEKLLDGRLLYGLDPGGTDTFRLASHEHSFWCGLQIQNIPSIFRGVLIADEGYYLSSVDFPQSEARCVAYASGDENLLETVESPKDYHAINAERFFGIAYDEIMKDGQCINKLIRDLSKRVNHGANYNMGALMLLITMGSKNVEKARRLLNLPKHWSLIRICEELLQRYELAYPNVKGKWYNHIKHCILTSKKLVSALGWTRYCFGDPSRNKRDLNRYVAHVPQNLSVGIINKCYMRIWRELQMAPENFREDGTLNFRLKAQVHDEIIFQYRTDRPDYALKVQELMNYPVEVTDCSGITRTMLIPPPPPPLGKTVWAQLK